MPEHETPRQAAERELLAARDEVRRMAETMRARLAEDKQDRQDQQDKHDQQDDRAGRWES